jgi:glucose/arabinose dehydrogenase
MISRLLLALTGFLSISQPIAAETPVAYQTHKIAQLPGIPWGMAFLRPTELLVSLRAGQLLKLNTATGKSSEVLDLPEIWHGGQGGLLDVAVAPGYTAGDWIYFTYSKPQDGKGATTLARARLQGNQLVQWHDLLVTVSATKTGRHFGSRIAFDDAGHLFFSVGDRGHRPNGQDLMTHAGSIMRLNLDGSIPADNPFINRKDALPEIWSYGHRNPQGMAFDAVHHKLWSIEHGPRGGDEINLILPGRNYGWPVISYGMEYWGPVQVGESTAREGMEQPVKVYIPSIAPGSLMLYSGKSFPEWKDNLFAGALKLTHLNRITLNSEGKAVAEERMLDDLGKRIRALLQSPEGWIVFSTDDGGIYQIKPK